MMMPAAGTPSLSKVSRSSTSGNTQSIYEDDEDGVVLTLEALISFLLAKLAFETRGWFDTLILKHGKQYDRRFYITILGHVIDRLFGPRPLPPTPSQSLPPPSPPPGPPITS